MKQKDVYNNSVIVEGFRACERKVNRSHVDDAVRMYEAIHGVKPNSMFMSSLGHVLENFRSWKQMNLDEASSQSSFPALRDYGFELVTALMPGLIANEIFTIQPAKFKNFSIFYQTFKKQTAKGVTALNAATIDALQYYQNDENYTRDSEVNKVIGTGNGSTANYKYTTPFNPIVPGTVSLSATNVSNATMALVDNGANVLVGDGTGSVVYTGGSLNVDATFNANVKTGTSVLLTYEFIGEGSKENAAELGLTITEIQGLAKERRLRYNFSIEGQFSYRQQWGRSMDADLLAAAMAEIRKEIDQDLILTGYNAAADAASAGSITWDKTPDAGVQYFFWREQFIDALNSGGNLIVKATGFGEGNVVVGGLGFKQVCETLGNRFVPSGVTGVKGSKFIGTIDGTRRCYYDPALPDANFFLTYKSPNPLEPGIVYSPWMPLFASDPHMLADGSLHRYLITSTGKTVINKKLFVKGTIAHA